MLTFYVFCAVLGGGFLLLSLAGGEGGDVELDLDADLDVAGDAAGDGSGGGAWSRIFSFRSLIYAVFGFGLTGSILSWLGVPFLLTLVAAVVAGMFSSALVSTVFGYLRSTESGDVPGDSSLEGADGRVVLSLDGGTPGAVVVTRGDREIRLRALPHPTGEGDPAEWERIMVVEMADGMAMVVPFKEDTLLNP